MAKVKKFKIEKFKYQIEDSKNQKTEFRRQETGVGRQNKNSFSNFIHFVYESINLKGLKKNVFL